MPFQRSISTTALLLAGISSVVGSGWLFGSLYAAQVAGPAAVLSWVLGGLLMLVISLTFAELGTTFPVAGGMIQYAEHSHGALLSFTIGWMVWLSSITVAPVETLGLIQYASNYIPGLVRSEEGTHVLTALGMGVAALVMMLMCVLNYYGAAFFSKSNNFITAIKLIVPTATVLLLLGYDFHPANFNNTPTGGFLPYGWHGVFAALPLGGVIYSFVGSNTVLQLAAETKNPARSIPFALIGTMVFCMLLYALLQASFIGALPADAFADGWKKLHFAGDSGPFSGLIMSFGLAWFVMIIYADAIISPFGTGFVFTAATARISYGLSQIGFLPEAIKKLSKRGVPLRSMILNYCVGLLLFLPFPGWQKLASFIISCFVISYVIGPISLVGLRKQQPDKPRPFLLPFANTISLIAFYICNLLIFWTGWHTVSRMMIALSIGFVFFAVHCYYERENKRIQQWRTAWWIFPYFIAISAVSYLGTFDGGTGKITFGMDFGVIGLVTLIIFYYAIKSVKKDIKTV